MRFGRSLKRLLKEAEKDVDYDNVDDGDDESN